MRGFTIHRKPYDYLLTTDPRGPLGTLPRTHGLLGWHYNFTNLKGGVVGLEISVLFPTSD